VEGETGSSDEEIFPEASPRILFAESDARAHTRDLTPTLLLPVQSSAPIVRRSLVSPPAQLALERTPGEGDAVGQMTAEADDEKESLSLQRNVQISLLSTPQGTRLVSRDEYFLDSPGSRPLGNPLTPPDTPKSAQHHAKPKTPRTPSMIHHPPVTPPATSKAIATPSPPPMSAIPPTAVPSRTHASHYALRSPLPTREDAGGWTSSKNTSESVANWQYSPAKVGSLAPNSGGAGSGSGSKDVGDDVKLELVRILGCRVWGILSWSEV
jgi:hypothetical protein